MKKLLIAAPAIAAMLTGCATLYTAMTPASHPQVGEKYANAEQHRIQVAKIQDGFVLARSADYHNTLLVRINTKHKYASDEYLIPGEYTYVGNWTVSIPGSIFLDEPKIVRVFNDPTIGPGK